MNIFLILRTSVTGMFPTFALILTGVYFGYKSIMPKRTVDELSKVLGNFFNPIFCFIYISSSFELSELYLVWPLIVGPFFTIFLFSAISYFYLMAIGMPKDMQNTFLGFLVFSNFGQAYILIKGMCSSYGPLANEILCDDSFSYISIFAFPQMILMWTYGYSLALSDKYKKPQIFDESMKEIMCENTENQKLSIGKIILQALVKPNPLSCILGILAAMIPGFKNVFYDKSSIIYFIADTGIFMSFNALVLGQVTLGVYLYNMKGQRSDLTRKTLALVVLFKSIVIPIVSLGIIYGFWIAGIFHDNKVMAYAFFLSISTPAAIATLLFAVIVQNRINEIVECIFWNYLINIGSAVLWSFLFFDKFLEV